MSQELWRSNSAFGHPPVGDHQVNLHHVESPANRGIPKDIEQFVGRHLDSVERLEVLLCLFSAPEKSWDAEEVGQTLYRQPQSVAMHLRALCASKIVDCHGEPQRYSCNPDPSNLLTLANLKRSYEERKDAMIRLIFEPPSK